MVSKVMVNGSFERNRPMVTCRMTRGHLETDRLVFQKMTNGQLKNSQQFLKEKDRMTSGL